MKSDGVLRFLADIGGTNARFALSRGGGDVTSVESVRAADYATPQQAIQEYLSAKNAAPVSAAIAVACPITGDQIQLTNSPWSFSTSALKEALKLTHLGIYNDFTAIALALPWLGDDDRRLLGGVASHDRTPLALLGPGTGLGVSALIPVGDDQWQPLQSEGGHVGFAPTEALEDTVLRRLRQKFGRLSAERVISGQGIENLYAVTTELQGGTAISLPAADIAAKAQAGDAAAAQALALFSATFGAFAGDLVLTLGAWGGVYIAGGIPMKLGLVFDIASFNAQFEAKGRYQDIIQNVPRWLITKDNPALLGLAHDLDRVLA